MATGARALKRRIITLLRSEDLDQIITRVRASSGPELLNPLFSGICHGNELIRWHAVTAMGIVVPELASRDMEAARVVMRRLMWSLNDESGGIGWGAPETMAEIMARHQGLAGEYAHILVSFMREDGFFLEYDPLQQGLMWGLGRMAQTRARLLREKNAVRHQLPYLNSPAPAVRGLAAWSMGYLAAFEAAPRLRELLADPGKVRLYHQGKLVDSTVAELAAQSLAALAALAA